MSKTNKIIIEVFERLNHRSCRLIPDSQKFFIKQIFIQLELLEKRKKLIFFGTSLKKIIRLEVRFIELVFSGESDILNFK